MQVRLPDDGPVVGIAVLRKMLAKGAKQYRVTAYDTDEPHARQVLVVSDQVDEATWLRHPKRRRHAMALIVPTLEDATPELLTRLTNSRATYWGVRDLFNGTLAVRVRAPW